MIAEIGHFALILALIVAVIQGVLPLVGAARGISSWMAAGRMCASANALFLTVAFASLAYCFYISDFTVLNVANNSNSLLPWYYKVAATWGSHEGSILFWSVTLSWWALAVSFASRRLSEEMMARVLGIMGLVLMGFLAFMLFTSNPFQRLFPAAPEGADLNPLLQDPGMVFHPPLLYLGYVGFSVPFAFALAALISGKLDVAWARWMRPWTTAAWILLTLGISLGSYWAYYELGWGGWWFWDPVENASFIPWLVTTAMLHAFVLQKTGTFRLTVFLALISFALCLFGSFMVRSGIVQSVHAFAADPARGAALLILSVVLLVPAFVLYAARIEGLTKHEAEAQGSPGGVFYFTVTAGIYLTIAAAASVLIGTLYPLIYDLFALGKISVGAPYFNAFFAPMTIAAAVLIGVVQAAKLPRLFSVCAAVLSLAAAAAIAALFKPSDLVLTVLGFAGAFWVASTALGAAAKRSISAAAVIAHLGLAVSMAGATGTSNYETENLLRMGPGLGKPIADLIFVYDETKDVVTRSYRAKEAQILVMNEKEEVQFTLRPQRQTFTTNGMEMTAAGIRHGLWRDIYVSLGNELGNGEYLVRISIKPLVSWLWAGALLMLLSLPLAYIGRRRKETQK